MSSFKASGRTKPRHFCAISGRGLGPGMFGRKSARRSRTSLLRLSARFSTISRSTMRSSKAISARSWRLWTKRTLHRLPKFRLPASSFLIRGERCSNLRSSSLILNGPVMPLCSTCRRARARPRQRPELPATTCFATMKASLSGSPTRVNFAIRPMRNSVLPGACTATGR